MARTVSTKAKPDTEGRRIITAGEILPSGEIIELLSGFGDNRFRLLFRESNGKQTVAREIGYSGSLYRALEANETIQRTIRFPHQARSYGSALELFRRLQGLFELHVGLSKSDAALLAAWATSTWFPDCLSSPPTLLIAGPDMEHAVILFRLLHCLCRRPVVLGDLNRTTFMSFGAWQATLLINQPGLSGKLRDLWINSNYSGVSLVGNGTVSSTPSPKAIFLGMADARGHVGMQFALRPGRSDLVLLGGQQQSGIADEIQPQLLMYRARNFDAIRNFSPEKQRAAGILSAV